jgi:hypothetical protein
MTKRWLAVYVLCAIAGAFAVHSAVKHLQRPGSISGHTIPAKDGPSALIRSLRPVYPYSVIAGGVYSREELASANSKDAVVRAHYADFNVRQAKLVQLTDDRYQYASYRVKDQVYWTKKKLRIPKGELLWSDGNSYARARCGNRLSDQPHQPVAAADPAEDVLSLPPFRPEMRAKLELTEPPPLSGGLAETMPNEKGTAPTAAPIAAPVGPVWGPGPAVFPVSPMISSSGGAPAVSGGSSAGGSGGGSSSTTPTPITPLTPVPPPNVSPVPEPGSALYLFFLTLAASLWAIWKFVPKERAESDEGERK